MNERKKQRAKARRGRHEATLRYSVRSIEEPTATVVAYGSAGMVESAGVTIHQDGQVMASTLIEANDWPDAKAMVDALFSWAESEGAVSIVIVEGLREPSFCPDCGCRQLEIVDERHPPGQHNCGIE